MSYELIYAKQFIKVKKAYIPIVLGGSSNCYEMSRKGKERRSRSWFNISLDGNKKLALSLKDISQGLYSEREKLIARNSESDDIRDKYDDNSFGYFTALSIGGRHTTATTFGQYKGLFMDGVKKALTVEQLEKFNIYVALHVFTPSYDVDLENKVTELQKQFGTVSTTEELIQKMELFETLKQDKIRLTAKLGAINEKDALKQMLNFYFPKVKKEKKKITLDKYFVIKVKNGYFFKMSKYGYKYAHYENSSKHFATSSQAQKYVDKIEGKGYTAKVETIHEKITL